MAKLSSSPKKKILVVDDDADTRSLLCTILEEEGHEIIQASDGIEALEHLRAQTVDLVITDRSMPRMDGMAFLTALRDANSQVPVLMISAYGEESFWGQAIGLGAVDYLLKPFKTEEVVRLVQKHLRGAKKEMIRFGTSGWRDIIAEEFTYENVRKVIHAISQHLVQERGGRGIEEHGSRPIAPTPPRSHAPAPVVVGYDTRFLSPELAKMTAEIVSSYGFPVLLSQDPIPTPVVSFQVTHQKAAGGINFTASHNPAEYNGIKFNMANGAPASPEVTHEIERLANSGQGSTGAGEHGSGQFSPVPPRPSAPMQVKVFDPRPAYLSRLKKIIDMSALKKAKLKVGVDVLYGTGRGYLDTLLREAGCQTTVLHDWRDVTFGGHSPEPAEEQLAELVRVMKKEKLVAGFGTDGDADRFGVVDADGTLLSPNDILPIVLEHLVKTRKWKGLVVRSVMTSDFIDAVAHQYGLEVKETPVGFKYIAEAMMAGGFLMGGEESGGLTIRGHVPEKDGILACLLMAEVRAVQKKSFRDILKDLRHRVGPHLSKRVNLHLSQDVMQGVRKKFETFTPNVIDGLSVKKIVRLDGFKFVFQDDSWMGVRLSGTEPVVRLYLESDSPKKLNHLEKIGTKLIQS